MEIPKQLLNEYYKIKCDQEYLKSSFPDNYHCNYNSACDMIIRIQEPENTEQKIKVIKLRDRKDIQFDANYLNKAFNGNS